MQRARREEGQPSTSTSQLSLKPALSSSTTMQVPVMLLGLLFTVAGWSIHVLAQPDAVNAPLTCCYSFTSKMIPMSRLESYKRITSSRCPKEAVVFVTKLKREVCADPKKEWVQTYIKNLDRNQMRSEPTTLFKTASALRSSAPLNVKLTRKSEANASTTFSTTTSSTSVGVTSVTVN